MRADKLLTLIGAIVIAIGIALIVFQMTVNPPPPTAPYSVQISPTHWVLETQYPGITLVCVGALLLIVGAFLGRRSN